MRRTITHPSNCYSKCYGVYRTSYPFTIS